MRLSTRPLDRQSRMFLGAGAAAALCGMSAALADIEENEVMLLYNSLDPESNQIANWYDDMYPGVVHCDIALNYGATVTPPDCWATSKYITPCKFKQVFMDAGGPFAQCLAVNPQILQLSSRD